MTDGWQRPDRPTAASIEVPLTGSGPLATSADSEGSEPPPNWRRIIGLASLGGVAGGIVVSVVLIGFVWDDDGPEGGIAGDPTTTLDFESTAQISSPPTLPPLTQVPTTETTNAPPGTIVTPPTTAAPVSVAPETFGTLPSYPRSAAVPASGLDSFDLEAAIEKLDDGVARRSTTHLETGFDVGTIEVTIVRDLSNNRYAIEYAGFDGIQDIVVDIDGGTTYFTIDQLSWASIPNGEVLPGLPATDLAPVLDRMMLGPLRPDTVTAATVEPGSMVSFDGGDTIAREFAIELPGDAVPEWQFYVFSSIMAGLPDQLRPETLEYLAYVDDDGHLNRLIGTAQIEDMDQLVIHRIERLDEPELVVLPDPILVRPLDEPSA